jgi:DNA processing protein
MELASAGVVILSGGARGIDTEAHEGALEARGSTVVVAPAGFGRPYPPENEALFERVIQSGGAYVALVDDPIAATRPAFFARNACLAALSWVVVVVQAGLRSGARNAAKEARRLGRMLFAVPSAPWIPKGRGCLEELRLGARSCERPSDILKALDELGAHPLPKQRAPRMLEAQSELPWPGGEQPPLEEGVVVQRIIHLVGQGASEVGQLADLAGLPVAVVNRILLTLRLQGVLVSAAPGHLALRKSAD